MGTIRIETDGASNLGRFYRWLTRHRGEVVQLGATKRLTLGVPISGASAVIVAADVEDESRPRAQLGGVVRAVSRRTNGGSVHLVFDGRALGGLPRDEAEVEAAEVLEKISTLVAADDYVAEVA